MAERALISRTTLGKVERGDPGVSMGTYATVLFVVGLEGGLAELADRRRDGLGLDLLEERLPSSHGGAQVLVERGRTLPRRARRRGGFRHSSTWDGSSPRPRESRGGKNEMRIFSFLSDPGPRSGAAAPRPP